MIIVLYYNVLYQIMFYQIKSYYILYKIILHYVLIYIIYYIIVSYIIIILYYIIYVCSYGISPVRGLTNSCPTGCLTVLWNLLQHHVQLGLLGCLAETVSRKNMGLVFSPKKWSFSHDFRILLFSLRQNWLCLLDILDFKWDTFLLSPRNAIRTSRKLWISLEKFED